MSRRIVIVGTGQAGCQLAASLRELKHEGEVVLLGDEPGMPYQKPPLSKAYLHGKAEADDLHLKPLDFFTQKQISLLPERRVTEIDRARGRVVMGGGQALEYDHLVLATGARNRQLRVAGAELGGIAMLRSLSDAALLRRQLAKAKRLVIVGAGFIGLEVAAAARHAGVEVNVIEQAGRVLARAVSQPVSDYLLARHRGAGVTFHFDAAVERFEGRDGRVDALTLSGGNTIPADLTLVAIGVEPAVELAEAAGLETGNGILVDEMLATADPRIHAIGDCANYPHGLFGGRRVRLESVQNAIGHARSLAQKLTGTPAPYMQVPWFWSDQGDIRLQIAGICESADETLIRGDPASGRFSVLRLRDGVLSAVESVNHVADHMAARRLLADRTRLDAAALADADIPLKELIAAGGGRRERAPRATAEKDIA